MIGDEFEVTGVVCGIIVMAVVLMPATECRDFELTGVGFFFSGCVTKLWSEKSEEREVFVLRRFEAAAYEYTPAFRVELFETLLFLLGGANY